MHDVIIETLKEMSSQDRCGTADFFYYTILDYKMVTATEYNYDEKKYYLDDSLLNEKEYLEDIKQNPNLEDDYVEIYLKEEPFMQGFFLTRKEAEAHLKSNKHHYTNKACPYVEHAWRSPETLKFFKALFNYFNVDKEWG